MGMVVDVVKWRSMLRGGHVRSKIPLNQQRQSPLSIQSSTRSDANSSCHCPRLLFPASRHSHGLDNLNTLHSCLLALSMPSPPFSLSTCLPNLPIFCVNTSNISPVSTSSNTGREWLQTRTALTHSSRSPSTDPVRRSTSSPK